MPITSQDILQMQQITEIFLKIDARNHYPFSHGLSHAKSTVEIMKKLSKCIYIEKQDRIDLLIACALHDIGMMSGRKHHGKNGADFVGKLLSNKLPPRRLEQILHAIEYHDIMNLLSSYPLFTLLVFFCDKMDFTCKRLVPNYLQICGHNVYEHVYDVILQCEKNIFSVNIITDKNITARELCLETDFFPKVIVATNALAKALNLTGHIHVDNLLL